ncbi:MAG: hypothetical protein ACO3P9_06600 [Phycisphaerales bacterium]|jgi:hypothetical protein
MNAAVATSFESWSVRCRKHAVGVSIALGVVAIPNGEVAGWPGVHAAGDASQHAGTDESPIWDRLDHDRFVERLGSLGLERTLEALETTEPSADEIETLTRRIARSRLPLFASERDPAEAVAAASTAVALRSALLDAAEPRNPLRVRWLSDQAEDILLWIVPSEGADLAVRFDTASESQRATVGRWLPLAEAASADAVALAESRLAGLDDRGDDASGDPAVRALASDLARARLLRGLTLAIAADLLDDVSDPAAGRRAAIELIEANMRDAAPDLEELGRLHMALARSGLGEHRLAIRDLTALAADAAAAPRRRFESLAGIVLDTAAREDPDNALERLASLRRRHLESLENGVFALPWADLEHRLLVEEAMDRGSGRDAAESAAISPWIDLIETRPPLEREAVLELALDRVRSVTAFPSSPDGIPAAVLLAHAFEANELSVERQRSLLESARDRSKAGDVVRLIALRRLTQLDVEDRRWESAIAGLRRLAIEYGGEAQAPAAIDAAVDLSMSLVEATGTPEHERIARDTVAEALRTFPRHAESDRWLLRQAGFEAADEQFESAMETLGRIRPDRPLSKHSDVQSLEVATRAAETADGQDVARWIDRAEAWLRRLEPWPSSPPSGRDRNEHDSLGVRVALARARLHLLADRPAAALVEVATVREAAVLTREQIVEGVRIRLAAFDRLDRPEDAAEELRRLSDGGDAESGSLLQGRLAVALAAIRRADAVGDGDRVARIGAESAGPLAEASLAWLEARDGTPDPRAILLIAEGLRRAGRPTDASRALDRLDERYAGVREYAVERAECLFAIAGFEELGDAMRLYRRIAAGSPPESPSWWLAELRQLQILKRVGKDVDRIPPRIERLRAVDPELGGEGIRRQFETLLLSIP